MNKIEAVLSSVVIFAAATSSCTALAGQLDQMNSAPDTVLVTGVVYGWPPCGSHRPALEEMAAHRYRAAYKSVASVYFVGKDGEHYAFNIDDSSSFQGYLCKDWYDIIVESPHGYPDTIKNEQIVADTTLELNIRAVFLRGDSVSICFDYRYASDSLGIDEEGRLLRLFATLINSQAKRSSNPGDRQVIIDQFARRGRVDYVFATQELIPGVKHWAAQDVLSPILIWGRLAGILPQVMNYDTFEVVCLTQIE